MSRPAIRSSGTRRRSVPLSTLGTAKLNCPRSERPPWERCALGLEVKADPIARAELFGRIVGRRAPRPLWSTSLGLSVGRSRRSGNRHKVFHLLDDLGPVPLQRSAPHVTDVSLTVQHVGRGKHSRLPAVERRALLIEQHGKTDTEPPDGGLYPKPPSARFTRMIAQGLPCVSLASLIMLGISSITGGHQPAQQFRMTDRPHRRERARKRIDEGEGDDRRRGSAVCEHESKLRAIGRARLWTSELSPSRFARLGAAGVTKEKAPPVSRRGRNACRPPCHA